MTLITISTQAMGVIIFCGFAVFAIVALFWANSKESRYIDLITEVELAVKSWQVTPENYNYIRDKIHEIYKIDCDYDRTRKLDHKFFWKYKRFFSGEIIKDEVKERVMA